MSLGEEEREEEGLSVCAAPGTGNREGHFLHFPLGTQGEGRAEGALTAQEHAAHEGPARAEAQALPKFPVPAPSHPPSPFPAPSSCCSDVKNSPSDSPAAGISCQLSAPHSPADCLQQDFLRPILQGLKELRIPF